MPDVNPLGGDAVVSEDVEVQESATSTEEVTTAEASETSEDHEQDSQSEDEQSKPKKSEVPAGVQKRLDKLTAKMREQERRAQELERELAKYRDTKPAAAEAKPTGKPTVDKFATYDEYVEALADWTAEQKLAKTLEAQKAESQKAAEQQRTQARNREWEKSVAEARKAHADYEDAIQEAAEAQEAGEIPILTPETFAAIMETDSKAEIMYYLAKNRADLERLANATGPRVLIELGKIEAKLTAPAQEKPPKVTTAPKPPSTVTGRAKGSFDPNDPNVSTDEWFKREKERLRKR